MRASPRCTSLLFPHTATILTAVTAQLTSKESRESRRARRENRTSSGDGRSSGQVYYLRFTCSGAQCCLTVVNLLLHLVERMQLENSRLFWGAITVRNLFIEIPEAFKNYRAICERLTDLAAKLECSI